MPDKQPSFGSLLEQLIMAPYAMRIDLAKRILERVQCLEQDLQSMTAARDAALELWEAATNERDEAHKALELAQDEEALPWRREKREHEQRWLQAECEGMAAESRVRELTEALSVAERAMREANRVSENAIRSRDAAEALVRELEAEVLSIVDGWC